MTATPGIRTRMTLLTCAVVTVLVTGLLWVGYSRLSTVLDEQAIRIEPVVVEGREGGLTPREVEAVTRERVAAAADQLRSDIRQQTLRPLLELGPLLVGAAALGGALAGWYVSGRALLPVGQITAAARRIASRNVHERLAWGEPRDELRELADTFDDLLARLEEATGDRWRFVANASHELKTPLAINRTLLEVAMGRPDAPPELLRLGETLLEVNARHDRLINGLLTLAHSEHTVARPVRVDLVDLVRAVARTVAREAEAAGVTVEIAAEPAALHGDPTLLERLVLNLAQNAIRYNGASGWMRMSTTVDSATVLLVVTNTGPEIAVHDVPALFEPFRRLQDRVGSAHGTGLGLSIVRSIARAHGGEAVAAPRPGGGLTVEVRLPVGEPGRSATTAR